LISSNGRSLYQMPLEQSQRFAIEPRTDVPCLLYQGVY
jgi:hypothetical protein